jgi:hypothetical protein
VAASLRVNARFAVSARGAHRPSGAHEWRKRAEEAFRRRIAGAATLQGLDRARDRRQHAEIGMHHTTVGAALLLMALPLAALAQTAAPPVPPPAAAAPPPASPSPALREARMKMRAACAGDMQKFCANVARGNGARQSCMRAHRAELTPACQAARSELRAIRHQEKG